MVSMYTVEAIIAVGAAALFLAGALCGYAYHALCQMDRAMKQADADQRAWHAEHRPGVPYDTGEFTAAGVWPTDDVSPEDMKRVRDQALDRVFGTEQRKHDEVACKLLSQVFDNESGQGACI